MKKFKLFFYCSPWLSQNVICVCATWKTIYHSAVTHTHTHIIHAGAAMWIRIGAVALCFPGAGKRRSPVEEGCVFTGQDKAVVVPGDRGLRERGSAR